MTIFKQKGGRKIILLAPIIVLCTISIFFFLPQQKIKNQKTEVDQPRKTTELPDLYVEGNTIKRSDNHEAVQLKGISTCIFAWNTPLNGQYLIILEKVRSWKINLLGFYIKPEHIDNRIQDLDYLIDWAGRNNIYVYLEPLGTGIEAKPNQTEEFASLMGKLSLRYKHKSNVLYGLFAEPPFIWKDWIPKARIIAKAITNNKPEAVIVFSGAGFSRDFEVDERLPYKNIVYNFHEYAAAGIKDLKPLLDNDDSLFSFNRYYQHFPVLIGEFGGVWESGFGEPEDLLYIQKILNTANKHGLSYTAYTIDNHADNLPGSKFQGLSGLNLINWDTNKTTKKGQLIKDDLIKFPPTDFSQY